MSAITKMSIQGVRSFGAEANDRQMMEFFCPLTLILGPNGSGKTTIIECLKYATTGEMPPGAGKGAMFVHDPKVARESEVKAQVKLQMKDMAGKDMTVTRSFVAVQTASVGLSYWHVAGSLKFKAQVKLQMKDMAGKDMTSHPIICGSADSVINSVILSPGESNWPLSEGKALKERFDEIFAATRYIKALDSIRKQRVEQQGEVKIHNSALKYLKQNKDKAEEIKDNMERIKTKLSVSVDSIRNLTEQLEAVQTDIDEREQQAHDYQQLQTQDDRLADDCVQLRARCSTLRDNINAPYEGSTVELQRDIEQFETRLGRHRSSLLKQEEQLNKLSRERSKLGEQKSQLLLQQGKLETEAEQHKQQLNNRENQIHDIASEYELSGYAVKGLADSAIQRFTQQLHELAVAAQANSKTTKTDIDEREQQAHDYQQLQTQDDRLADDCVQLRARCSTLRDNINAPYEGSTVELQRDIEQFETRLGRHRSSLLKQEEQLNKLSRERSKLGEQKSQLLLQQGKLETEAEQHKQQLNNRENQIHDIASEYELSGYAVKGLYDSAIQRFTQQLHELAVAAQANSKTMKAEFEEKEAELQRQIDSFRDKKTRLQQEEQMKGDTAKRNVKELHSLGEELSRVDASKGKLEHLDKQLRQAESELRAADEASNIEELKADVQKLQSDKAELEKRASNLDTEMGQLHTQSKTRTELDMLRKEKTDKEDTIRKIRDRHEDTIVHLLGHFPTENVNSALQDYIGHQAAGMQRATRGLNETRNKMAACTANRNVLKEQVDKKDKDLRNLEEKIYEACGSQDFDASMEALNTSVGALQDEKGALTGARHLYSKFVKDLRRKAACPLCRRAFPEPRDVDELVQDLNNKLRLVPNQLDMKEKAIAEQQVKYGTLLQLKPQKEQMATLSQKEVPALRQTMREMSTIRSDFASRSIRRRRASTRSRWTSRSPESVQADVILMDRCHDDVRRLESKIATMSARIVGAEVIQEKEDVQVKLRTLGVQLDGKREQIEKQQDGVQALRAAVNDLNTARLQVTYLSSGRNGRLEESREQVADIEAQLEHAAADTAATQQRMDDMRTELSSQQVRQRELQDSLEVRRLEEEEKEKVDARRKLEKQIGELDRQSFSAGLIRRLQQKREKLRMEKHSTQGRGWL
ncbi:PREDICTED: DNA repair protein RAD50-like [Priapulus caudatus]|uniref:DNA repair protein RAD50-like n=1 Tax=Priapulus caudatus TaxID=37621 RepID=A0ABM1EI46_PRICU|nr:PREDICTED: DNA repair protein RAD50-like [Priapulus caudatus]